MQRADQARAASAEQMQSEVLTRKADYAQSWYGPYCIVPPQLTSRVQALLLAQTTATDHARRCRCNPSGAVLTPVADNVWGAERPFTWNGIDVGGRGAVIRLSDGTIWTQASC